MIKKCTNNNNGLQNIITKEDLSLKCSKFQGIKLFLKQIVMQILILNQLVINIQQQL